jgi:predicted helicase
MPRPLDAVGAAVGVWCLELRFKASRDEEADWSWFNPSLRWLTEIPTRERVLLCEGLRRDGRVVLSCEGPEEALRLLSGVRGPRIVARVLELDGREVRPEGHSMAAVKRARGVYATPPALTRFVVRSVDTLLRNLFGTRGLADPDLRLLDPAAGPMNFVLEAYRRGLAQHRRSHGRERLQLLLRDHLIPHFRGIEILPGPWAEGQRAVRQFVERFEGELLRARVPLFLADALASPGEGQPGGFLGQEALAVERLREERFAVILGNPPFRGHSANPGGWIADLLRGYALSDGRTDEGYFQVDGHPLGERNLKWLQDDYVKFLRLGQWMIDQAGQGIVAFVLNHNCLDAPTFRGVRRSLLCSFDQIFALDLHGNQRRRERGATGERDDNVFQGVAQGIAVLFLVKRPGLDKAVYRGDLFGGRKEKLRILARTRLEAFPWKVVHPRAPHFHFASSDRRREQEYAKGVSLPEIFPVHSLGMITGRDARVLAFRREDFEDRMAARSDASRVRRSVSSFLYRPFDLRQLYEGGPIERPRATVMTHLRQAGNVGLLALRQSPAPGGAFVSRWIAGHKVIDGYAPNTVFPLYLLGGPGSEPRPNLCPSALARFGARLGELPAPESLLGYLYAVLHDPLYLSRFADPLRRDFPRIPLPPDGERFQRLASLGNELVALHLLEDPRLAASPVQLDGDPCTLPRIEASALRYDETTGRVRLNRNGLAFEGIAPEVWRHRVGSYTVLERWLQSRAECPLNVQMIRDFRWIAEAVRLSLAAERRIQTDPIDEGAR